MPAGAHYSSSQGAHCKLNGCTPSIWLRRRTHPKCNVLERREMPFGSINLATAYAKRPLYQKLLNMELKLKFRAGGGILYPHVLVLLDLFLAIGSDFMSNKQAKNYSLVIICWSFWWPQVQVVPLDKPRFWHLFWENQHAATCIPTFKKVPDKMKLNGRSQV